MTISLTPALDDAAVRVAVRARPLLEREVSDNCQECVTYSSDRSEVTVGKERRFTFDHVFGPHVGQEEVYLACVKPLVDSCVAGYNATVLAYGQTGSGKTHTMGSANSNALQEHELGILPRVIRQLYNSIEEHSQAEFLAMEEMVQAERETWEARAVCAMRKQEQLERDHQALKEELENTRSLMQKAGLGIRLSAHNVRELSNGDVDVRTSITC